VVDGGWPGSCHEHELIELAGLDQALDGTPSTTGDGKGEQAHAALDRRLAEAPVAQDECRR
jgi:hypothetical protein